LHLSGEILAETRKVLLEDEDLRENYPYSNQDVVAFLHTVRGAAGLVTDVPPLQGRTRDPNDDHVVACALAKEQHGHRGWSAEREKATMRGHPE
jgi:hypothetical protein